MWAHQTDQLPFHLWRQSFVIKSSIRSSFFSVFDWVTDRFKPCYVYLYYITVIPKKVKRKHGEYWELVDERRVNGKVLHKYVGLEVPLIYITS